MNAVVMNRGRIGRRNQKGIGLIELAISLAIAAGVLWGIFKVVGTVNAKRQVSSLAQSTTMMGNDLRTKFSEQGNFAGLTTTTFIQLGIPPEELVTAANTLETGFSTPMTVAAANINGVANDGFAFTFSDFPAKSCGDFVMAVAPNFSRVTIGSTVVKNMGTGSNDPEITVADLANCAGSNGVVSSIVLGQGR
ncbi:type II secretion system protein [Luteimonas sp. MHLX1A]|uniref:type II secretion system protein n=1 Tax=Alterluteimonas muca TaxID=2878684 RepID=UPI001E60CDE9|nr:type 4 pilus major pilin [Luteimonas sp. MHLX1A]MCD9046734.1 hypothetical protein [Luteimonas sp. MHLX1A]